MLFLESFFLYYKTRSLIRNLIRLKERSLLPNKNTYIALGNVEKVSLVEREEASHMARLRRRLTKHGFDSAEARRAFVTFINLGSRTMTESCRPSGLLSTKRCSATVCVARLPFTPLAAVESSICAVNAEFLLLMASFRLFSSMHWYKWTHVGAIEPRIPLQEPARPLHELHLRGR